MVLSSVHLHGEGSQGSSIPGQGSTQMAKMDIQSAYRLVPVHPSNQLLLGVRWYDACCVDGMLPFGLRSAPKIFTPVANALEWCLQQQGFSAVDHYLEDFITIGPTKQRCVSAKLVDPYSGL